MQVNPCTGNYQFTCPFCGSFLNIQPYVDLKSDYVGCPRCHAPVHVPSLIDLETDPKPFHPCQLRRQVRLMPNGRRVVRTVVNKGSLEQLTFGGDF